MRLIDADAFTQQIAAICISVPGINAKKACAMIELIKKQPTAYDVEELLEELRLASLKSIYNELSFYQIEKIVRKVSAEDGYRKNQEAVSKDE